MDIKTVGVAAIVALGIVDAWAGQDEDVAEGEKLYVSQCKVCHGNNSGAKLGERTPAPAQWWLAHATAVHAPGETQAAGPTRTDAGGLLAFAPPFGPNLRGIVGRPAGTYPGYEYSATFIKALTGMTWTEGTLDWWIRDTQAWVPGTIMFYRQKDEGIRRKIILYLQANP